MRTSPTACPRVVELFEARSPKGVAPDRRGRRPDRARGHRQGPPGHRSRRTTAPRRSPTSVSKRARLLFEEGDHVEVGDKLHIGAVNPHEVLRILGPRQVQLHLVAEVQEVYRSQGVSIHDKHIEVIIRQMLKRVNVLESGATDFLPGALVERADVREREPPRRRRGRRAGLRPSGPHGHHQGLARDRVVAVGGLLPGDDPRPHRRGDPGQERLAARPEGERHHRQAHPGRYRHQPLPQHPGRAHRGGPRAGLLDGRLRRPGLRVRHRRRPGRPAGRLRLRPRDAYR